MTLKKDKIVDVLKAHMKDNSSWDVIDKKLSKAIKKQLYEEHQIHLFKKRLELIELLSKRNLSFAVLKGLVLAKFNTKRTYNDLDILVYPKDIEFIIKLLVATYGFTYDINELAQARRLNYKYKHHIVLFHRLFGNVEIHYQLVSHGILPKFDFLKHTTTISIQKKTIPCLIPELQLIHLCLSCAYHDIFISNYSKLLTDITTVISHFSIDWKKFIIYSKKLKQCSIIYHVLYLLKKQSYTISVPRDVMKELKHSSNVFQSYILKYFNVNFIFYMKRRLQKKYELNPEEKDIYAGLIQLSLSYRFCLYLYYYVVQSQIFMGNFTYIIKLINRFLGQPRFLSQFKSK